MPPVAVLFAVAAAQTALPSPEASKQPITSGPLIAGVCFISPEAVLQTSKVGLAATARLRQLADDVQQEASTQKAPLDSETRALEGDAAKLPAAELQKRRQTLADDLQAFRSKVDQYNRELEYTRERVIQRISQQAQPPIAVAYAAHGCGLLFRSTDLLGGNAANDLTAEVVRALDAKVTTITFDREVPPPAAAPVKPSA